MIEIRELMVDCSEQIDWFKQHKKDLESEGADTNYASGSINAYEWVLSRIYELDREYRQAQD